MKRVGLAAARDNLSALVNDAAHGDQRILIESRGHLKAAIIGPKDLDRLERLVPESADQTRRMLKWLAETEKALHAQKAPRMSTLEALREIREERVADSSGVYRRQRRRQAGRRRRR